MKDLGHMEDLRIFRYGVGSPDRPWSTFKLWVCLHMGWHTQFALHDGVCVVIKPEGRTTSEQGMKALRVAKHFCDWRYESYYI